MMLALSLLAILVQEAPEAALARKCDSQIPWIADGTELIDMELAAGHHPQYPEAREPRNYTVDRAALLARAKKAAAEQKRLILWYCPRMSGLHMYRAVLLDRAMKAVAFTDPRVVDLITRHFVPLRMCCDAETGQALGLKAFEFVEPGFIVMTAEGKIVHTIDKIRTFNSDWFHAALSAAAGVERAREEKAAPEKELYLRAGLDAWSGKDPAPRLRALIQAHPDSPWAWRAAANLVPAEDSLPSGPLAHHLETFSFEPFEGVPRSTRLPAKDADVAERKAVEWLLRAQWEDGGWRDARYAYWPDAQILPNIWTAVTALAALALVDRPEAKAAVARADAYLRDEKRLNPGKNEECYAQAFRLHYFAKRGDRAMMARIVERLGAIQDKQGFWSHEYPNPFSTAVVVHALATARKAGVLVPVVLFQRGADALLMTRGDGGRQAYRLGEPPDSEKNSMSRTALCELALWECGRGDLKGVAAGVAGYWKFVDRLEAVRVCDYHSDGRLAGFFFFHAGFHLLEAALALDGSARDETKKKLRDRLLKLPEYDGSFIDSHEIGKSYGTAMALLILSRTRP